MRALERLAHGREGLEEEVLERLTVGHTLLELGGLPAELLVGELLEVGLERRDVVGLAGKPLQAAPFAHAQDFFERSVVAGHRS